MNYGAAVRRVRKAAGHSLRTMALALGCTKGWISDLEANRGRPSLDLLEDVATVCGISLSRLITYAEELHDGQTQAHNGAVASGKTATSQEGV